MSMHFAAYYTKQECFAISVNCCCIGLLCSAHTWGKNPFSTSLETVNRFTLTISICVTIIHIHANSKCVWEGSQYHFFSHVESLGVFYICHFTIIFIEYKFWNGLMVRRKKVNSSSYEVPLMTISYLLTT